MITTIGIILAAVFTFIAGLHIYWVFGGKWGFESAVPDVMKARALKSVKAYGIPFKLATLGVAIVMILLAWLVLCNAGLLNCELSSDIRKYLTLGAALVFLVRAIGDFKYVGMFKIQDGSPFAISDTKIFAPLCLGLALLLGLQTFHLFN